jgi:hypothetical protein
VKREFIFRPAYLIIAINVCLLTAGLFLLQSCGSYSFTGTSTPAKTISLTEFYNNADLGPANMGQTFTNDLKTYLIQNSNLSVIAQEGELQMSGEIMDFRLTPIAPVSTGDANDRNTASSTRLTITVRVTYINTLDETMSFKDKSFSFYQDFDNDQNFSDVEEQLTRKIFDQLMLDIYNASIANW